MIVSCTTEGYNVPGSGFSTNAEGEVTELVASYPACTEPTDPAVSEARTVTDHSNLPESLLSLNSLTPEQYTELTSWAATQQSSTTTNVVVIEATTEMEIEVDDDEVEFDAEFERERRERMLDLHDHGA
jgi:hypothetical protein